VGGGANDPSISISGIGTDGDGNLVINQTTSASSSNYMWLADTASGMVSKFDLSTGRELARYRTTLNISCNEGETPESNNCTGSGVSTRENTNPSRTAIDIAGNAWVANRGFEQISSVTKIAADESDCIDRNGNGQIDTSRDLNGNGAIEADEMVENDECVLFTTPVCNAVIKENYRNGARALAISKGVEGTAGDVWVGCYDEGAAYQLNSSNGRIERGPIALGIYPYGAIVDGNQNVWMSSYPNARLQGVNTTTGAVINVNRNGVPVPIDSTIPNCSSYGLAVDPDNRIWLAGIGYPGAVACAYDHYAAGGPRWRRCELNPGNFSSARGIVADVDGNIYMSSHATGHLTRFRWDDANNSCRIVPFVVGQRTENTIHLDIGDSLLGVGFDAEGNPWTVALGNRAARVNLRDGSILRTQPANAYYPSYYTYSDFTGYQLKNFTAPRGSYTQTLAGCERYSSWKSISWEASVPANTRLEVYVRVANSQAELALAYRHGPFTTSPVDLSGIPKSSLMQLEFVLISEDRQSTPSIHGYALEWACEQPLN